MKMNNDTLYGLVRALRKYVTELVNLNHKDASNLDASDWKNCLSDIAEELFVIETYIRMEGMNKNESIRRY